MHVVFVAPESRYIIIPFSFCRINALALLAVKNLGMQRGGRQVVPKQSWSHKNPIVGKSMCVVCSPKIGFNESVQNGEMVVDMAEVDSSERNCPPQVLMLRRLFCSRAASQDILPRVYTCA